MKAQNNIFFLVVAAILSMGFAGSAQAVVFKTYIPGVTMSQMKTSADCAIDWPVQEFGLVYQDCHQLYGRIDFQRGAKTLRRLTLVARDLAEPEEVVARIMRKRFNVPDGTFDDPEVVVTVKTTGSTDALRRISAAVPAAMNRIALDTYFYYVEVSMNGPVEFAGVIVEYNN